jgi:hypothetical protein
MDKNIKETKYPKSKHGFQCIGPCYKPGTVIIHPITLEYVTDKVNPFCPVKEWIDDKSTDRKEKIVDVCANPTHDKNISGKELEMNMLTPQIDFNNEQFLKIYYEIYSIEDALLWLSNKEYVPLTNKMRVISCAIGAYGKNMDMIDSRLVNFLILIIKKKWLADIYLRLNKYVHIDNDTIEFSTNANQLNEDEYKVPRMNFIVDKLLNFEVIENFLEKYVRYKNKIWDEIISHLQQIKIDLIDYLEKKIKVSNKKE